MRRLEERKDPDQSLTETSNLKLDRNCQAGVCPWARLAYAVGSCMVVAPLGFRLKA